MISRLFGLGAIAAKGMQSMRDQIPTVYKDCKRPVARFKSPNLAGLALQHTRRCASYGRLATTLPFSQT